MQKRLSQNTLNPVISLGGGVIMRTVPLSADHSWMKDCDIPAYKASNEFVSSNKSLGVLCLFT